MENVNILETMLDTISSGRGSNEHVLCRGSNEHVLCRGSNERLLTFHNIIKQN